MPEDIELIAKDIVDSAFKVHSTPGPGLLETAYQRCLGHELRKRGRKTETEVAVPILFDGEIIEAGYRIDVLVEGAVIIENKTVESILPIHLTQMITYLKLKDLQLGFLINWNVKMIKNGIRRVVNGLQEPSSWPRPRGSL